MTIEEKIYALLSGNGAVTALVPSSRIKPPGFWQNMARPYIVHRPVAAEPIRCHSEGLINHRFWDPYQVSVISDDYASGRPVINAVRDALDGVHAGGVQIQLKPSPWYVGRDSETNTELFALDFFISEAL